MPKHPPTGVKKMTAGEQMVWAAVFAKRYDVHEPPGEVVHDTKRWREWESGRVAMAVENAHYAVIALREARSELSEDFQTIDEML